MPREIYLIMDKTNYVTLLEEHGIKPTANRIVVAEALASSIQPQSLADQVHQMLLDAVSHYQK